MGNVRPLGRGPAEEGRVQQSLANEAGGQIGSRNAGTSALGRKGGEELSQREALGDFDLLAGIIQTDFGRNGKPIARGNLSDLGKPNGNGAGESWHGSLLNLGKGGNGTTEVSPRRVGAAMEKLMTTKRQNS